MRRITRSLIAAVCCLSILLSLVPVTMAAQSSGAEDDARWEFYKEDFESDAFAVGEGTLWNAGDGTIAFNSSYKSNVDYNVAQDENGKYAEFKVYVGTSRGYFAPALYVSGEKTVQFDYMTPRGKKAVTDYVDVQLLGTPIRARINQKGKSLIYSTQAGLSSSAGISYNFEPNVWYTVKLIVEVGRVTMKIWERDTGTEPEGYDGVGITSTASDALTAEVLSASNRIGFMVGPTNVDPEPGDPYTCGIDNVSMSKKNLSVKLPKVAKGRPGAVLNLNAQISDSPQPSVVWSSADERIVKQNALGEMVGVANGETTVTMTVLDSNNEPTNRTYTVPVVIGDASDWELFTETFDTYEAGEDAFYGLDTKLYQYDDACHASGTAYTIASDSEKYLKLQTATGTDTAKFGVNVPLSGEYTLGFDYMTPNKANGAATDLLDVQLLGTGIRARINDKKSTYIYAGGIPGLTTSATLKDESGLRYTFEPNTWYSVKIKVGVGNITMKVWDREKETEPDDNSRFGVVSLTGKALTAALLDKGTTPVFTFGPMNIAPADGTSYACGIDNLSVTKEMSVSVSPSDDIVLGEEAIGTTVKLSAVTSGTAKTELPAPQVTWESSDPGTATVSQDGTVTIVGGGKTTVRATVKSIDGRSDTMWDGVNIQVGSDDVDRILIIGNSFSRDSLFYLPSLARMTGNRIEACFLHKDSGTIRDHARNAAKNADDYHYYKINPYSGLISSDGARSIKYALFDGEWDYVVLQQGSAASGFPGTYNSDVEYLLDMIDDLQPDAKIYWNMTWAMSKSFTNTSNKHGGDFNTYYKQDEATMYNAIVDCVNKYILNPEKFGKRFDGVFYTGAAIQNARATALGDTMNRDGYHLSQMAGRMTAAMTLLKTLYPDADLDRITPEALAGVLRNEYHETQPDLDDKYVNNAANLALIKQSVIKATTTKPEKLPAKEFPKTTNGMTVVQTTLPVVPHFPDITTLADGTLIATSYDNVAHTPTLGEESMQEGVGVLTMYQSKDNGATWQLLYTLDEAEMERLNMGQVSGRYAKLKKNPNAAYNVLLDPRDGNLAVVYTDMDGDGKKEEVLLLTTWLAVFDYLGARSISLWLMYSQDGGKTWTAQNIDSRPKRGDIAVYNDGEILVPVYSSAAAIRLKWNGTKWEQIYKIAIPNTSPSESSNFNEISLASPYGDDTTYAFVRESGAVLRSDDRGQTWREVANEDGVIHQPGFAGLGGGRLFTTYAKTTSPRDTYGKVFYTDADWTDTATRDIYVSPNRAAHDEGDPSSTMMADGRVFVIAYDTAYSSLVGRIIDPNSAEYLPVELGNGSEVISFSENYGSKPLNDGDRIDLGAASGSHTVSADVTFAGNASSVTLNTAVGNAVITPSSIRCGAVTANVSLALNKLTHIKVSAIGKLLYVKAWQGNEPASWNVSAAMSAGSGAPSITGAGVSLSAAKLSRRVEILLQEKASGAIGAMKTKLDCTITPAQKDAVWSSSDESVVTVSQDGEVSYVGVGKATVTVTVGNVSKSCEVTCTPVPNELTGAGSKKTILADDFETYSVGTDTFWDVVHEGKTYASNAAEKADDGVFYDIIDENGNQVLKLTSKDAKATWHKVNTPITGNYSVQFDFKFNANSQASQYLYLTLYQDSNVNAFVHLTPNGVRFQYKPLTTDLASDSINDPATPTGADLCKAGTWHTIRISRVSGALYVKVWDRGTQEPENWSFVLQHEVLDASKPSYFRMQYYVSKATNAVNTITESMLIDNLTVSQQSDDGTYVAPTVSNFSDVKANDYFAEAVKWASGKNITSGTSATTFSPNAACTRAQTVTFLWRAAGSPEPRFGKNPFTDVKESDYFYKAVLWAFEQEITTGTTATTFSPNAPISRGDVVTFLFRSAMAEGVQADNPFTDVADDAYYAQAVTWAYAKEITTGTTATTFSPGATCTRAQIVTFLYRHFGQ